MAITGLEIVTRGPRPIARAWATALTTYPELTGPEYQPDAVGVERWLNGVQFTPFGCDLSVGATFDPCVTRETDYNEFGECVKFYPFLTEIAIEAPTREYGPEELQAYLIAHSEMSRSSHLAAQVERSAYNTANPSLASEAQVITNTDQSLLGAVMAVEEGLADLLDGGAGMIHLPAFLLTALQSGGGLRYDAEGRAFTPTGHVVVADAGHLGVSPVTSAVVADEIWVYGSGPVFAKFGPVIGNPVDTGPDYIDFSRNRFKFDVEQYGIAIFEPCSVVAAVVDTSDANIVGQTV